MIDALKSWLDVIGANVKHWLDAAAISTVIATIAGWLPSIAAALSIVWTLIRIYETKTVQRWLGHGRQAPHA